MAAKINSKKVKFIKTTLSGGCDKYHCCFCLKIFETTELTIEHIIPKVFGGTNELINLALSCNACNNERNLANFSAFRDYKAGLLKKKPEGSHGKKRLRHNKRQSKSSKAGKSDPPR